MGDSADPGACDQTRPFEHAQVLGDGGSRHVERLAECANGTCPVRQLLEDPSTRGIGQRREHRVKGIDCHGSDAAGGMRNSDDVAFQVCGGGEKLGTLPVRDG